MINTTRVPHNMQRYGKNSKDVGEYNHYNGTGAIYELDILYT